MQAYDIARSIALSDSDTLIIEVLDTLNIYYPCTYKAILSTALDNAAWHLDDAEKEDLIKILKEGESCV